MSAEVQYTASRAAQRAIDGLGRTEDLQFSPSNRRLAVAAFHANRIAVFEVSLRLSAGRKHVDLSNVVEFESPTLQRPHGLSFLDEDTVVVANREGAVQVFGIPALDGADAIQVVPARQTILGGPSSRTHTPGSVAVYPLDDDTVELLVCNNYAKSVTRHVLDRRSDFVATADDLYLKNRLDVPDGVCVSADGRWVAVSNHNTHNVLLYDRNQRLNEDSEPGGVLRNVLCPHGVRFTPDDEHILVADAGARFVNVYRKDAQTWEGVRDPVRMFPVMTNEVFVRGRHNPQEGGPKGIDIGRSVSVLAVTCESRPLAFFDVDDILRVAEAPVNRHKRNLQFRLSNAMFKCLGYMPQARDPAR